MTTSPPPGNFLIYATDGKARQGSFSTAHGTFSTPAFMPVGTQGTVKSVTPRDLQEIGAEIILSNTYHLHIRPGDELIRDLGGLHRFMGWNGPILTDSGGYQVFSLAKLRQMSDEGVDFQSHVDGQRILLTPERVIQIQENLGVDIMMVLDECLPYPAEHEAARKSWERTLLWAKRSLEARRRPASLCFGIVQGGMHVDLREQSAKDLIELGFDSYAIGGLSVGEPPELMLSLAEICTAILPQEKIRYLMGVGMPSDIVQAVERGIDLFDCVIPTRSARFGRLFTGASFINIRNQQHRTDPRPVEEGCDCYSCTHFSRAYLAHLTHAREILAIQLCTLHNLRYFQRLMCRIRGAIVEGRYGDFVRDFLEDKRREENGETHVQ